MKIKAREDCIVSHKNDRTPLKEIVKGKKYELLNIAVSDVCLGIFLYVKNELGEKKVYAPEFFDFPEIKMGSELENEDV